jgi:hypothetical protein
VPACSSPDLFLNRSDGIGCADGLIDLF